MISNIADKLLYQRAAQAFAADKQVPDILVQESTNSVFGRDSDWRDVRSRLRRLPLPQVLALLSAASVDIERGRKPFDAVVQYRIAERLSDGSRRLRGLLRRLANEPPRIVVHEEQLAIVAKMAILYCEGEVWTKDSAVALLETLLAYNSIRQAEIVAHARDDVSRFLFHEIRSTATDNESEAAALQRFGSFMEWSKTDDARRSRHYINLDQAVMGATGLTYLDFAAAQLSFYTNFGGTSAHAAGRPIHSAFLNIPHFIAGVKRPEVLKHWFDLVSIPLTLAKERLATTRLSTSIASLQQFMETPLISVGPIAYCPALRYLPNVAATGMLFRLCKHLALTRSEASADHLRGFFAEFLEVHVFHALQNACKDRSILYCEKTFGRTSARSSDIAVFDGDNAVFIDVNSKRFHVNDSVLSLDVQSIERDLDKMIVSKVKKIAQRAIDFRRGVLRYEGIDPEAVIRIFGLVVTPQGVPRFVGITRKLDELLPALPDGLDGWEYFDLGEVELLGDIFKGGLDLASLITSKAADEFGRPRSLANFLYFRMPEHRTETRSRNEVLAAPWFQKVLVAANAWGLPS